MRPDGVVQYRGTSEQCNADQAIGRFEAIVRDCSSFDDVQQRNLFLNTFQDSYNSLIENLKTQITNMLFVTGNGASGNSSVATTMNTTKTGLEKEKARLEAQKKALEEEVEATERNFLDSIYNKEEPGKNDMLTLQDVALAVFALGWLLMGLTLIYLRAVGPTGSFRGAMIVLVVFLFVTILMYGILQQLA